MLLVNSQGFNSKLPFNKEIIRNLKPNFGVFSEINMRASQADTIYENFIGYASCSQTPDLKLSTSERLKWKPTQGFQPHLQRRMATQGRENTRYFKSSNCPV